MSDTQFQVTVFKADKRTKTGKRKISTSVVPGVNDAAVLKAVSEITAALYPKQTGFSYEIKPATKIVKSLMTGKDVEIPVDTPWCCNPASETYWSM